MKKVGGVVKIQRGTAKRNIYYVISIIDPVNAVIPNLILRLGGYYLWMDICYAYDIFCRIVYG